MGALVGVERHEILSTAILHVYTNSKNEHGGGLYCTRIRIYLPSFQYRDIETLQWEYNTKPTPNSSSIHLTVRLRAANFGDRPCIKQQPRSCASSLSSPFSSPSSHRLLTPLEAEKQRRQLPAQPWWDVHASSTCRHRHRWPCVSC